MQVETSFTGFADRSEAGHRLAGELRHYQNRAGTVVIGLPRGGAITAAAVAEELSLPLDVLVVRKLGVPHHEELAMGAIGAGGVRVWNHDVMALMRVDESVFEAVARSEQLELERRELAYRGDRPPLALAGQTVIVVDDGLATGSTMAAAINVLRKLAPRRIVLAVPVSPVATLVRFRNVVDEIVYLETPDPFRAVGDWYVDFGQIDDAEVTAALARQRR